MGRDIYINKRDLCYNFLACITLLASILLFIFDDTSKYISVLSVMLPVIFCLKFIRTLPLIVLFAYISMYAYESTKFFFTGIMLSANKWFQTPDIINKALEITNLFVFSLGVVIPSAVSRLKIDLKKDQFESQYIFWGLCVLGAFMIQFGIRGESLLSGVGYGGGSQKSTLHEYFLMVYLVMLLVFPRKNTLARIVVNLFFFVFCFKTLIYGGRIEVMQISLLFLYFFWGLRRKINKPLFYLFIIIGLYFNSVFSIIRSRPLLLVKGDYWEILNPVNRVFEKPGEKRPYLLSNEGDVLQSSTRILGLIEKGYLPVEKRLLSFTSYLFSFLLPASMWPEYALLASYKQNVYNSGGGGLISVYFFVWLGYAGPILIGLFIGTMLKKLFLSKNIFFKIYGIALLFTMPRWFAYTPSNLVKFIVYTIILYGISKLVFYTFLRRKAKNMQTLSTS